MILLMPGLQHFVIGCTLSLIAGLSTAAGSNAYRFDNTGDYLAAASEFASWSSTLERHQEQQLSLYACPAQPKSCRGRLRSFHRVLEKSKPLEREEQIELVQFYINRTRYDDDHPQRIFDHNGKKVGVQRNHWSTLYDFLIKGGDCEDYAAAKYFMLRELGFAPSDMRVVVTYERRLRGYHAVLAVQQPNGAVWLLDSDNRIRKKSHRGYRYIYAMNEDSVWDHRADFGEETSK